LVTLVAIIGRVELPIDADVSSAVDPGYPTRHDDPFLIGLDLQHREACAAEVAEEGRIIDDDDVILVTFDVLLPEPTIPNDGPMPFRERSPR